MHPAKYIWLCALATSCAQATTSADASDDRGGLDAATLPRGCSESFVAVRWQYPGEEPRAECLPSSEGLRLVSLWNGLACRLYYEQIESGVMGGARALLGWSVQSGGVGPPRHLDTIGPVTLHTQFADTARRRAHGGICAFVVTAPGPAVGDIVQAHLASPCRLANADQPAGTEGREVVLLDVALRARVVAAPPVPTHDAGPPPDGACP